MKDPALAEKHRESGRVSRRKTRDWLAAYKMERGCRDCDWRHHFSGLQLDHEGEKTAEISSIRTSVKRLMAEIESGQCVVRCANCHSVKTWAAKNGHSNPTGKCFEGDECS